jgi:transcriptional regulator with XRE-family HTH domain
MGACVAARRKELGMTQEQLAEQLDVLPGYLRRIETGRENLTVKSLVRLANALDLEAAELLRAPPKSQ